METYEQLATFLKPERVAEIGEKLVNDEVHAASAAPEFAAWLLRRVESGQRMRSSHGSLLAYCLGLSDEKPSVADRKHLWYDPTTPDIDVDLADDKRHLTFEHISRKYGAERVARIGTVGTFKSRSALNEVGMALRIPKWKVDAVAESMIKRSSGDSRALATIEDTMTSMPAGRELLRDYPEVVVVTKMEGHPRNAGQHAAGVVISDGPLDEIVAVDRRTGATMCDKEDAENDYGLLKIDVLGLTQLSIFADTLARIGKPHDFLDTLPLDDEAAFEIINQKRYAGIFQFEGQALQSVSKQIKITEFEDFVALTALARPGPLASGGTTQWVKRRIGAEPVVYPHEMLEPYLKQTRGVMIYQEQILTLGRAIGELDWPQLTKLRKAMSKSLGKEYFDQFGDPWKAAAIRKGIDPVKADAIWTQMCAYGSYGFNRSHAYSYGLISYWCAWLKAHHPLAFLAATLTHTTEPAAQISLLRDLVSEGYDYVPVDPATSTDRWEVTVRNGKQIVVGPLTSVKGIGGAAVKAILDARGAGLPMPARYAKLLANPVTPLDSLFPIRDALATVCPDLTARNIFTTPTLISVTEYMRDREPVLLLGLILKINPRDENEVIQIAKRGGVRIEGDLTTSLNVQLSDDTGIIFCKISRYDYPAIGKQIVDRGGPGKALWALKGSLFVRESMRMLMVKQARFLGLKE
jgi:DNA polymerase-3 subunit alpha